MINPGQIGRSGALLLAFFYGGNGCLADSIDISGNTSNSYEEYYYGPGTGYTSPLDQLDFSQSGAAPGSFLFTTNTMYEFNGTPSIGVLTVNLDPTEPVTQLSSSSLPAQSSQGTAPEPASFSLAACAAAMFYLSRRWLTKAR